MLRENPLFWNKVLCEDTLIVYIVVKYVLKYVIIKIPHYVCILIVLYPREGQKQITYSRHHDILIPAYIGMSSLYITYVANSYSSYVGFLLY